MKDKKRILAIAAVVILIAAVMMPMFFAFGTGENSQMWFRVSLGIAITVPVFMYICLTAVKVFGGKRRKDGEVKNIIFDVGNVLLDYNWEGYLRSFGFDDETNEKIAEAVFRSKEWNERDRGLLTEKQYVDLFVANAPEYEAEIRKVMKNSEKTISKLDYAVPWVRYLKDQGYHLYILSNYCERVYERTNKYMEFLKHMDGVVFSYRVKMIKPEPEIFQYILKKYDLKPEESVFIDDRADNCAAAEEQGIHAVQFTTLKEVDAKLKKLGIDGNISI